MEERIRLLKQEVLDQLGQGALEEIEKAEEITKEEAEDENIYPSLNAESKLVTLDDPSMSLEPTAATLASISLLKRS